MVQDAIIVGAGAAGLVAALRAARHGLRVVLLEGGDGHKSNLMASGGMFSAAGTRFQAAAWVADSAALWADDIARKTEGKFDPTIVEMVTSRSAAVAHFLADEVGIALHLVQGFSLAGHSVPRLHATAGESGRELGALLLDAAQKCPGIDWRPHSEATELEMRGEGVTGVRTQAGGLAAAAVILAAGGFAGNRAMLTEFAPDVDEAVNIGMGPNDGCGITWASELGAALAFMDSYQGQGHATVDGLGRLGPGLTTLGAIMVNREGAQFGGEAFGPSELAALVLAQPGGWAAEIFSARMHETALRMGPYREAVQRGVVLSAETPEVLAERLGIDAAGFARTLRQHNRAAAEPITPPIFGARVTGALAHTQGGVRVDRDAQVLRRDGTPISGLFAAGGVAAGISGRGASAYIPGNGLTHAFVLGMIAADAVATKLRCRPSKPAPGTPGK